ncbi:MAG: hypothetical protein CME65_06390 [Halobacteriovoraceae bacterium]|nr:hypothetical protein [Halobacteriovoraceae bacterium]|tara:strand:+ start:10666 stop:13056 length:2391 start_codon:yes stop_codon:yes gene_type:complete
MNIKVFWGILFLIITNPGTASDFSCDEARRELVAIEALLLDSKMPACGSEGAIEEPYCCNESKPNTCKNRRQLEIDYNAAVGELVIKEGIVALGLSIESNHNALNRLGPAQAEEIRQYARELDENLTKAEVIYMAMEPITSGGQDFVWSQYNGYTTQALSQYMSSNCPNEPYNQAPICQRLNAMVADPENYSAEAINDVYTTLNGFLNADNQMSVTDGDDERSRRFSDYRNELSLSVQGEVDTSRNIFAAAQPTGSMSPIEFRQSEIYQNVQELPVLLSRYEELLLQGQDQQADDVATRILQISNSIDPIRANFQVPAPVGDNPSFLSRNFGSVMNSLNMPDLLLTEPVKKNFEQALEIFKRDKSRISMGLNFNIRGILTDNQARTLPSGQTIGEACNNEFGVDCLETLCPASRCPTELDDIGIRDFQEGLRSLNIQEGVITNADTAIECFDPDAHPTTEDKRACLMATDASLANVTTSDLEEARNKVEGFDQLIAIQDVVAPFNELNVRKALTLETLNSTACTQPTRTVAFINRGFCQSASDQAEAAGLQNIEQQFTEFVVDGENVIIELNNEIVRQGLSDDPTVVAELERGRRVLDTCQPDDERSMCIAMREREEFLAEQELLRAERETRITTTTRETGRNRTGSRRTSSTWSNLGEGFLAATPLTIPLIYAWGERQQVKDWSRSTIAGIQAYDDWYMNTLDDRREFYNNYPTSISNWGYDFSARNDAYTYTSFQSGTTNLFGNSSGSTGSFSFAAPPLSTGGSGITFNPGAITPTGGSSTGSGNSSTTTSFGF